MFSRPVAIFAMASMLPLGACAVDPNVSYGSYLPDFLKQTTATAQAEAPPDVAAILRANVNVMFVSTSTPTNIRYSPPVAANLDGWETCVRANLTGATGKSLGERTYLVNIQHDQIGDRQLASGHDHCAQETYKSLG
jgi:hypothetical protein